MGRALIHLEDPVVVDQVAVALLAAAMVKQARPVQAELAVAVEIPAGQAQSRLVLLAEALAAQIVQREHLHMLELQPPLEHEAV